MATLPGCAVTQPKFAVILPAAGKSSRFRDKEKKPFANLDGRAVWLRSVELFVTRPDVVQCILVIARALIHRPAIVFADEPTASLDQATGRDVINLLADYRTRGGGSVVVVTHDPAMLTGADRVLQMRDGRLSLA